MLAEVMPFLSVDDQSAIRRLGNPGDEPARVRAKRALYRARALMWNDEATGPKRTRRRDAPRAAGGGIEASRWIGRSWGL